MTLSGMLAATVVRVDRGNMTVPFRILIPLDQIGIIAEESDGSIFILDSSTQEDGWHLLGPLEDIVEQLKKLDVVITPLPNLTKRQGPNIVPIRREKE